MGTGTVPLSEWANDRVRHRMRELKAVASILHPIHPGINPSSTATYITPPSPLGTRGDGPIFQIRPLPRMPTKSSKPQSTERARVRDLLKKQKGAPLNLG